MFYHVVSHRYLNVPRKHDPNGPWEGDVTISSSPALFHNDERAPLCSSCGTRVEDTSVSAADSCDTCHLLIHRACAAMWTPDGKKVGMTYIRACQECTEID